jgi:hypothetical protein
MNLSKPIYPYKLQRDQLANELLNQFKVKSSDRLYYLVHERLAVKLFDQLYNQLAFELGVHLYEPKNPITSSIN